MYLPINQLYIYMYNTYVVVIFKWVFSALENVECKGELMSLKNKGIKGYKWKHIVNSCDFYYVYDVRT